MLNKDSVKYSYNDITVIPTAMSDIKHRSETNPFYDDGKLPIFTAKLSFLNLAPWQARHGASLMYIS